jgi:hypothetical protein
MELYQGHIQAKNTKIVLTSRPIPIKLAFDGKVKMCKCQYDSDRCEGLADENLTATASSFNKYHIFKLQHYTLYPSRIPSERNCLVNDLKTFDRDVKTMNF